MRLLYFALRSEAQYFIEKLKAKKISSKLFIAKDYFIVIGGVGKEKTIQSLQEFFNSYKVGTAFNIGIAGVNDQKIAIGSCYTCTKHTPFLPFKPLYTSLEAVSQSTNSKSTLYDMEGAYFLQVCQNYLSQKQIHIIKVVSDHLHSHSHITKAFVKEIMIQNYQKIIKVLNA